MIALESTVADSAPSEADLAFWRSLRDRVLPLRPSQYDLTSTCNLQCEGCLFFSGSDYLGHTDVHELATVDTFFAAEAARGVRYGYFGGAEPSLVQEKLVIAARHLPYGVVFTNGTQRISDEVPFRIHVSVWGRTATSRVLRGADVQQKQVRNYRGDKRAVFVMTLNARNIDEIGAVAAMCADNDLALSFNHYSPTQRYTRFIQGDAPADRYHASSSQTDNLVLRPAHLARARELIARLMDDAACRIIYSREFNDIIHDPAGLYPELQPGTDLAADCGVRLTASLRHYNTDFSASSGKCCTPNVDCRSCRLYAQSYATVLARATRSLRQPQALARAIRMWRVWCALFLNDDGLAAVASAS